MASSTGYAKESEGESEELAAESLKDKVAKTASHARRKANELSQNAVDKIDQRRTPTADALESAASTIQAKAERVSNLAHKTAEKLQTTANYVRERDARAMIYDFRTFVTDHPAESLIAALTVGFLFGRAFRRD
jgi:ElaB/YqjD/DUF883 family membrane-anchored ribosome-binding protein